jgi:twitching motility protein PilT
VREAAKEAPTRPYSAVPGEATLTSMSGIPRPPELDALLRAAVETNASDLHLVAGRPPLFRVAFELGPRGEPLSEVLVEKMVISIVPARLRGALEADGSADFAIEGPDGARFRVNVASQRTGFKIALRVIPREVPTLAALGLPEGVVQATHHHQGLIVVTGPTGHGKTTTLAAIVDRLNSERSHHIITVEDPVEHVHPRKKAMMSQREVGVTTKSFLTALKGSLREDPDVIVVGELRDVETVRMAVSAGETGHLVLGTMNTPNAAKAIERLIDLFPPGDQAQIRMTLAGALRLVVGQRLVPSPDKKRLHAAIELLPGSTSLSALIRDNRTFQIPSLQQRGKGLGIVRLDESLAALVREKKVTMDDAKAVAEAPGELEALVANRGDKPAEKKPEGLLESLFGRKG